MSLECFAHCFCVGDCEACRIPKWVDLGCRFYLKLTEREFVGLFC